MNNDMLSLAVYLLLGIPLFGLYAYMYDRLKRAQPDGKSKDGLLSAFGFLAGIWILPFRYLKFGRKEKDGKALVVFLAYWVLLATAILLGGLAAGNGKQAPNPSPAPTSREGATGSRTSQEGSLLSPPRLCGLCVSPFAGFAFSSCAFLALLGGRNIFPNRWKTFGRCRMKLKKRKLKFAAIFGLCWFALLVLLVDGVVGFPKLVDRLGSHALTEVALWLLVLLPTAAVYISTKEPK